MQVIKSIEFSLFSPEQIRKMSAVKITVPDTYDEDGYPISGGLADQHLGIIDPGLKCKTCGGRIKSCSGHFGHIELVRPVVHIGFAKTGYQLLRATCRKCGRVLAPESTVERVKKVGECPHCGEKQKQVKFVKPTFYYEEDRKLLPNETRERLERIPDEDLKQLGVAVRPEWMVLTVLMVPPVTVRPSITLETGERSEDDLTHKLVDILRINQRLGENIDAGAPQLIIEDLWELLQYHVTTYFDNETAGIPPARHRSGRQLKTLFQRLKGKEGRFRYNLSGKRVNFSARTVVSPDPTLGINELGIPEAIADELTVPESVTSWNTEEMKELVRQRGHLINYVIRPDGKRKKLTPMNAEEVLAELAPGYVLERKLQDGDIVIFNRQPSLHRVSMLCHSAKILPGKTLRLNVADCKPYNADFDGDEMNIHVPQNEEAQTEAEILMKVQNNMVSPRCGEPLIAPTLDHLSGLFVLTQEDLSLGRKEACEVLAQAGITAEFKEKTVSGREVFGKLLPQGLSLEMKNRTGHAIKISKGRFSGGHVDDRVVEKIISETTASLGTDEARKFVDATTKASTYFLTHFGLSLSLEDYQISEEGRQEIRGLYRDGRKKVRALVEKYRSGKLERKPGKTVKETFEEEAMGVVEGIRDGCNELVLKHIKKSEIDFDGEIKHLNPAIVMAKSKARGSLINIVQMCGLVGQQAVRGKRMHSGFQRRVLSHFRKGELGDEARGFVASAYTHGLTPLEYFFHAAGGRDSVVDKGVNPAKTGYMQRRLINAMQDLYVAEDLSVRDAEGKIIQFTYGDDAKDPTCDAKITYGEPVGVVAAQSIGEPGTQMSIPADEKVIVKVGDEVKPVAIGEFVDGLMNEKGCVKAGKADVLNLSPDADVWVPSLTDEGKIEWKKVIQCSRHECDDKILEIRTRSGRRIRATASHSFVVRKQGKITPVAGSTLRKGDRIPVVKNLASAGATQNIAMEDFLPKDSHWFGSELQKALAQPTSRVNHNDGYCVPVGYEGLRHYAAADNSFEIEDGFVYPVQNHGEARIPELELDPLFGWFVGAYLSEGSLTRYNTGISNTDEDFLEKTRRFASQLNLRRQEKDNARGFALGHDLTINSSLLSEFLEKTCGRGSAAKKVPAFAYNAPEQFVSALLSAYFDGDGNVSVERNAIRASSNSKELVDGIALLLARLGLFCTKHAANGQHCIWIPGRYAQLFKEKIGFTTKQKKVLLNKLCARQDTKTTYDVLEMVTGFGSVLSDLAKKLGVPSRLVNKCTKKQAIGRRTLEKYAALFKQKAGEKQLNIERELAVLRCFLEEDVAWDEITSVGLVESTPRVYDFAVEGLETFTTFDGVITHNTLRTFHYAGVLSLAQLGFTRLVEIVDARKTPKNPVMEVALKPPYSKDYNKVRQVAAAIEEVKLEKIAEVKEDFEKRVIRVAFNADALKEYKIGEDEVLAKIKAVAACEKTSSGCSLKPQVDTLRNIRKITNKLRDITLRGVPGITRAIIIERPGGEYVLATEGTNLEYVFRVPEVDPFGTTTNDIAEIGRVLGIEAARNAIIVEVMKVLDAQGIEVDVRHVMLIADAMTYRGSIKSVGRHGLAGEKASVLARAAFEETAKHLTSACVHGESDRLRGVAENIIIGQTIPCGTGKVDLEMDVE
ncbi:MAG: DNA-directed RNA polymerase subunit A' [Candidatus Micrarchaeota archaeon]